MRAIGVMPSSSARARDITTAAAAPSLSGQEFPAVTRPFLRNTVRSPASLSRVVSALGPSSSVMVSPEASGTGMISRAKIPSLPASTARMWLCRAYSSISSRVMPYLSATFSAVTPIAM